MSYTENTVPVLIDNSAVVSAADSANFDGGNLQVGFSAGGTADDQLAIRDEGTGAGQIGVSGSTVSYGGVAIGSFSGGNNGTTPLVITFNASATPAAAQALARNITFWNTSDNPATANRTVQFVLNDGTGGVSAPATQTIAVTAVDDAPVLTGSNSTVTFTENGAGMVVDPNLTLIDVDGINVTGATVTINSGFNSSQDALLFTNQLGITGSYNPTTGVLTLSGSAPASDYQTALRSVAYRNSSDAPSTAARGITFGIGQNSLYLPATNHYYEFVSSSFQNWTNAKNAASARSYYGLQGYLVTLTSPEESAFVVGKLAGAQGWFGASDGGSEGNWRWVTGPEGLANGGTGTQFWQGGSAGTPTPAGSFSNWNGGEPNDMDYGGEDYAQFVSNGRWNDLGGYQNLGYIVEYGGMPGEPTLSLIATATVNVIAINDVPVANNRALTVAEDSSSGGNLVATDADGDPLTYRIVANGGQGVATITNPRTGAFTYTPNANFNGSDSFTFQATDDMALAFDGVNDYAVASLNAAALSQLTVEMWVKPSSTTASGIFQWANGLGTSTPFVYFYDNGSAFTLYSDGQYTLSTPLDRNEWTHIAVTFDGTTWRLYKGGALISSYNGTLSRQNVATAIYLGNGYHGFLNGQIDEVRVWNTARTQAEIQARMSNALAGNEAGLISYHRLNDGSGSAAVNAVAGGPAASLTNMNLAGAWVPSQFGASSNVATVVVTVTEVNDSPVGTNDGLGNLVEDASAQTLPFATLLANDSAGPANESGQTLTIAAVGSAFGGSASISGGNIIFTPTANYNGPAGFTYTLQDNGTTNGSPAPKTGTANVTFSIIAVNDPPTVNNDSLTVAEDSAATVVNVLANDSAAPDTGETLTVTTVAQPANGMTALVGGVVRFTPAPNFHGTTTFNYTISDGNGGTSTATVTVTVTPVNDPPTATNDSLTVAEDSAATVEDVLANDSIVPDTGETLIVTAVNQPANGTVTLAGGVVRFAPAADFNGTTSFSYTIADGNGGTATAIVTVTVTPVNDQPVVDANGAGSGIDATATFTENAGTTTIVNSADLTVADADTVDLDKAVVAITNLRDGAAESLAASPSGAISAGDISYDAVAGLLTIDPAGSAPLADFQAVLRTLSYNNTLEAPDAAARVIDLLVNDGEADNAPVAHITVTIDAVNDAPVNTVPAGSIAAIEDTDAAIGGISVADADAAGGDIALTLAVNDGVLTIEDSVSGGVTAAQISGNGTDSVVVTAPLAALNATLADTNGVVYHGDAGFSGSDLLTVTLDDLGNSGPAGSQADIDTVTIAVAAQSDLQVSIVSSPIPASAGAALRYTVTITNTGPSAATNVALTTDLSSGVTFSAANPAAGCSGADPVVCDLGTLAVGATAQVTLDTVVNPGTRGTVQATANVSSDITDPNTGNNQATATTAVNGASNLALTSTTSAPIVAGLPLTYTLTVTNTSLATSFGVVLTDTLPSGVTFAGITPSQGSCSGTGQLICQLGDLAPNDAARIILQTDIDPATRGTITNTAEAAALEAPPVMFTQPLAVVAQADVSVTQTATPNSVEGGNPLTYTFTVANAGPSAATNVGLDVALPDGVAIESITPAQGSCTSGTQLTCALGTLSPNAATTVTIVVTPSASGTLSATAQVTAGEDDLALQNNTSSQLTTVPNYRVYLPVLVQAGTPDLAVTSIKVQPDATGFNAGDPVEIVVEVENRGTGRSGAFWVDLGINPDQAPTQANQPWNEHCTLTPCQGLAWYVTGLAPGEHVTLTSKSFPAGYSIWYGYFAAGTTDLYAYADSYSPSSTLGMVAESDEVNNAFHLGGLMVQGTTPMQHADSASRLLVRPAYIKQ